MSPPVEHHRKDDRLSLLTNLHRSYGQTDNGIQPYGQEAASVQQQFSHQQHLRNTNFSQLEPEKIFCLRQQFLMAAAIIVVASLVVFVLFVTTFRKVPSDDSFLNIDSMSGQEFSPTHRQVAVKTSCGHVIGKSEDDAYVFKVSYGLRSIFVWFQHKYQVSRERFPRKTFNLPRSNLKDVVIEIDFGMIYSAINSLNFSFLVLRWVNKIERI
ncbi:COesterase domain-containing protein [Trichonephila inaurata madagascariensis]|uniref:COesterase domain-containing protein n=1 Tax=Trichonephila inaurata madagascariensis TaxID=2747483 RepID=A0A8X6Y3R3_9ARAC|nr:COesterase domain-containing protein [Trichonephila inaurata madagascariensis]